MHKYDLVRYMYIRKSLKFRFRITRRRFVCHGVFLEKVVREGSIEMGSILELL